LRIPQYSLDHWLAPADHRRLDAASIAAARHIKFKTWQLLDVFSAARNPDSSVAGKLRLLSLRQPHIRWSLHLLILQIGSGAFLQKQLEHLAQIYSRPCGYRQ
jgi:hypothetical protein